MTSDWMNKLKLEKYADIFHEKQVDGYLLMQLDKQMLKTDFGMGDFDIMKLTAFAKSGFTGSGLVLPTFTEPIL
jgi:hypothetical protein